MSVTRLPEIIGSALKAAREKRGMERSELATQCCLSSKMILELEEGGLTSFYNFQLKLNSAKRVGGYLGLAPSDYLTEVVQVVENKEPVPEVEDIATEEEEKPAQAAAPKPVVDEGEQLDDLIYESTNSGTSLPHISMPSVQYKKIGIALGVLIVVGVLYGLESRFEVSSQTLAFIERMGAKKVTQQEPPKEELAEQESQQELVEEKPAVKIETKVEPVLAAAPAQAQCPQVREDQLSIYKSANPSKLGDAVNLKTLVKQSVCFSDGQGRRTMIDLEPNSAHTFRGVSPFIVSAEDLDNVEMYYQGWRVRPPSPGVKQMKLVEVAVQ